MNCNNGCVSMASQVVINAGITPTVNTVPNQALCPGASTTAVTFSGTPTGVTFGWTNNNTSIGLAASGSGNISSFVAVNATTINQVATITVTPSYTSGGVTCMGTPFVFTITVYANLASIAITETSGSHQTTASSVKGDGNTYSEWRRYVFLEQWSYYSRHYHRNSWNVFS
ncbi:MAG: hypothetical protein IPJ39_14945 [Saprospiraceae bacterium]|nr:hypothetical protein [Saprospiraceae bacterium]